MKIKYKNSIYQEQRATIAKGSFHSAPVIALCPGKSCLDNFLQHSFSFVCCVLGWMTSWKCILDAFSNGANMKMPGINTHQGCISYRAWTDNYSSTFSRAQGRFHTLSLKEQTFICTSKSLLRAAQPVNLHLQTHPSAELFIMREGEIRVSFIARN